MQAKVPSVGHVPISVDIKTSGKALYGHQRSMSRLMLQEPARRGAPIAKWKIPQKINAFCQADSPRGLTYWAPQWLAERCPRLSSRSTTVPTSGHSSSTPSSPAKPPPRSRTGGGRSPLVCNGIEALFHWRRLQATPMLAQAAAISMPDRRDVHHQTPRRLPNTLPKHRSDIGADQGAHHLYPTGLEDGGNVGDGPTRPKKLVIRAPHAGREGQHRRLRRDRPVLHEVVAKEIPTEVVPQLVVLCGQRRGDLPPEHRLASLARTLQDDVAREFGIDGVHVREPGRDRGGTRRA